MLPQNIFVMLNQIISQEKQHCSYIVLQPPEMIGFVFFKSKFDPTILFHCIPEFLKSGGVEVQPSQCLVDKLQNYPNHEASLSCQNWKNQLSSG